MQTFTVEIDGVRICVERNSDGTFVIPDKFRGIGTALKPAFEPILLARKPLIGTVAANILRFGTGAINVDGCRVAAKDKDYDHPGQLGKVNRHDGRKSWRLTQAQQPPDPLGRWPANIVLDGSVEVLAGFPDSTALSREKTSNGQGKSGYGGGLGGPRGPRGHTDSGSAARFFYTAKADSYDRLGFTHPTIKPVDLLQWLVRLVTPKGGTVLDPFSGTGTTAEAAFYEGMRAVLIEREPEYQGFIRDRMNLILAGPAERSRETIKRKPEPPKEGLLAMMDGLEVGGENKGEKNRVAYGKFALHWGVSSSD